MPKLFLEYARLLRLSGLIGFSMAPVFGALSLVNIGYEPTLFTLFLLLLIGALKAIVGFVLNDFFDIEVDSLSDEPNKRPLVSGAITKKTALSLTAFCFIAAFAIVFIFFFENQPGFFYAIICILAAIVFGTIYNKYGKKFIGSDILVGLSEGLFVLTGAFLVSTDARLSIFTWMFSALIFTQYLYMNAIMGGLKDADHDYKIGAKNIALKTGVKVNKNKDVFIPFSFKALGFTIRLFSSIFVFIPFIFFDASFENWHMVLFAVVVGIVLILTVKMLSIKSFKERKKVLSLFAVQGVLRYSFLPLMLIPIIGVYYSVLLIVIPIVWYFIIATMAGQNIAPNL
jgi:4-hydroxybenzoate polyprenyltransferase